LLTTNGTYPVIGFALKHTPNAPVTGDVFTLEAVPGVKYEPWLGYRIDCARISDVRKN